MSERLSEPAPAKINLALHVVGQRPDGFHLLHSLCVFTDLADQLFARPSARDQLTVSGPFGADLPTGRANLAVRALEKFRARFPDALPDGVSIELEKHLPVASGLGGGSADAAAVLRLLARMALTPVTTAELLDLAATLGADVPMCLLSQPCEVSGIGEIIRPLSGFPHMHLVLVNPREEVSTPDVFKRLAKRHNGAMPDVPAFFDRAAMLSMWLEDTRNDLESAAMEIVPAIAPIIAALTETTGCVLARMSGSGATCFGLYGSEASAHQSAHDLRDRLPGYWISATPLLA